MGEDVLYMALGVTNHLIGQPGEYIRQKDLNIQHLIYYEKDAYE
jgi:hypothetical protein